MALEHVLFKFRVFLKIERYINRSLVGKILLRPIKQSGGEVTRAAAARPALP
jgi:hypothetical protein